MRLDKILSHLGYGSRKDVKKILKSKRVEINEKVITKGDFQVNIEDDEILIDNQTVTYEKSIYLMLHKPSDVVSATMDKYDQTVIDLLPKLYKNRKLFPVGRLDKDTEGLLLLTNDGEISHKLTSPKHRIEKKYYAIIDGKVEEAHIDSFKEGITLDDNYKCKPAKLEIISSNRQSEIELTIIEGKFHQVKRMFEAINMKVIYLKRIQMGEIKLDEDLQLGDIRLLNKDEVAYLNKLSNRG